MAKDAFTAESLDKIASRLTDVAARMRGVSTAMRVFKIEELQIDAAKQVDSSIELIRAFVSNAVKSAEKAIPDTDVSKFFQRP